MHVAYWFIIQVVANVILYRRNASASSNIAQGCAGSRLDLQCSSTKVIRVTNVHLGISGCKGISCCIQDAGCSHTPSEQHLNYVNETCDGRQNCTVELNSLNLTPCESGWWATKHRVDGHVFERITYSCRESIRSTPWSEVSRSRETTTPKHCSLSSNTTTSANGTTRKLYEKDKNNTKENSKSEASPTADESNSQTPAVVMVIIGIVILITIVVLVVVMFRRKICEKDNLSHPIAMSQIDNLKDEADIYANETEGNSPQDNEDQDVYSQVKERKLGWKEGQSDRVATNKTKAATEAHTAEPDVYAVVNKSSKTTASSSASKIHRVGGKVLANNDEYFPEQLYALASDDMADIYANEPAMQSLTTQSMTGAVSKTPSSQDDEGQTVIENDLYGH